MEAFTSAIRGIVADPYGGRTRAYFPSGALVPTHRSGERSVFPGELPA